MECNRAGADRVEAVALAAGQLPIFRDAQRTFASRWESATEQEGGEEGVRGVLRERVGGSTFGVVLRAFEAPVLGHGIGLGTNVGAMRARGRIGFVLGEAGWDVTIAELGPALGLLYIGLRVAMTIWLLRLAWRQAVRGNAAPLILGGSALPLVFFAPTAQSTALGFIVVGAGLMLAAGNATKEQMEARLRTLRAAQTGHEGMLSPAKARSA